MNPPDTLLYAGLSPARKRLVDTLHELRFGRIANLSICCGEPQWTPPPTIIQTIKLPLEAEAGDLIGSDHVLKTGWVDLFRCFDRLQNAVVSRLECRFGLPCLVEIATCGKADCGHQPDRGQA